MPILVVFSCNLDPQGHLSSVFVADNSCYHSFVLLIGLEIKDHHYGVMAECTCLLTLRNLYIDAHFVIVHRTNFVC